MKAFIVLALVACAAARSMDVERLLLNKEQSSLLSRDDLLKSVHRFGNKNTFDFTPSTTPSYYPSSIYNGDDSYYNTYAQKMVSILSYEEIVGTELFREYYNIPLFRQFLEQYPTVFRRYIESPLFQQFWTYSQFQQYFRNPVYFYKYIVPQVQIVAQTEGTLPFNYNTGSDYSYEGQDYPVVGRRELTVGDYLARIYGQESSSTHTSYPFYPYSSYSNSRNFDRYSPVFGRHSFNGVNSGVNSVNYKFLLDKIYRTLFVNQPTVGDVTQVRTDVEVAPAHKQVVVEPITGETKVVYEQPKIVDVKVAQKVIPRVSEVEESFSTEDNVKESLLKRFLVTKRISVHLYEVLKTLPLHHVKEILRRIVSSPLEESSSIYGDDFDYSSYPYNQQYNHEDSNVEDVVYRQKINQILSHLYNKDIVGDRYTPVVRDLLKTFGHRGEVLPREVQGIFRH